MDDFKLPESFSLEPQTYNSDLVNKPFLEGALFFALSLVGTSFLSCSWLLLNLSGLNWRRLEIQKRHRIDRQKVQSGVLGAWVEIPNPHCFFSLSLFFKALLLAVL
jgi:hypothetical protein